MISNKIAVFTEDSKKFDSYEEFAQHAAQGLEDLKGKTLAFVNVEYRQYGVEIYQVNIITVSTLTIPEDGTINLSNLVIASASSEALLPRQKSMVYQWIMSWIPKNAWNRTPRYIKSTVA